MWFGTHEKEEAQGPVFDCRLIEEHSLINLLLIGRSFTWYMGDGKSMSILDRFLLSDVWCVAWSNWIQMAQLRGLLDHYLLVLSVNEENWGPKPFRLLKCWVDVPGYK